jgi:predicted RNase H-like HicB family nuclease
MENFKIIIKREISYIPVKSFDWIAYIDGMEEDGRLYGFGETKEDALQELKDILEYEEII